MKSRANPSDMVGALGGVAFCVLLFLATATFDPLVEATDAELAARWSDSGHLRDNVISMYLMLASVPFLLLFLAALRGRLVAAEEAGGAMSAFLLAAGMCFAAALLVTGVTRGAIAQSVKFGDEPLPGPDTLRTFTSLAQTMYRLIVMPAAAVTLASASWLVIRSRVMAAWVGWAGFLVAGVIAVLTPLFITPFALPLLFLWVTATSIELWRTRQPRADAAMTRVRAAASG